MPAQSTINLLDQPEFESSSVGRLLTWAITYGRYIMIGTEIIVLLAFISRFSLDRKLTDLREEIAQKQVILEANQKFEQDFVLLQQSLIKIRQLINTQDKPVNNFYTVSALLPQDVSFLAFSNDGKNLEMSLLAGSTDGLSIFLRRLQGTQAFTDIDVNDIQKDALRGTQLHLTTKLK